MGGDKGLGVAFIQGQLEVGGPLAQEVLIYWHLPEMGRNITIQTNTAKLFGAYDCPHLAQQNLHKALKILCFHRLTGVPGAQLSYNDTFEPNYGQLKTP